jgi:hypothetical protein
MGGRSHQFVRVARDVLEGAVSEQPPVIRGRIRPGISLEAAARGVSLRTGSRGRQTSGHGEG